MRKLIPLAALLLAGCAGMTTEEKRTGFTVLGAVAGVALIAATVNSHNEPDDPKQCTTVIRPSPGGGIGTNETFC